MKLFARAGEEGQGTAKNLMQGLEQLFAVVMRQKIQCVGRESASKVDESTSYQVLHSDAPRKCLRSCFGKAPNKIAQPLLLQPCLMDHFWKALVRSMSCLLPEWARERDEAEQASHGTSLNDC